MTKMRISMLLLLLLTGNYASADTVELAKTGQTLCYDVAGKVITCAGTGQDGETQIGLPWPAPRFTDQLDGTVTDNLTGLIWLKNASCTDIQPSRGTDWISAIAAAGALHSGQCALSDGSLPGDWRLPNAAEMASLVDLSKAYPSLPAGNPFTSTVQLFWTSTTYPLYPGNAEGISMGNGCIRADTKTRLKMAWPVKGTATTVAKTGQNTCWDINGTAISCSGTGQDGDKQAGVSSPTPRFVDNGNGTMVDLLTHLVWLKNANCFGEQDSQEMAIADATNLASGACGLTDGSAAGEWRLPNRNEMRSLANYQATDSGAWLDSQGFTNAVYAFYWTSDSYPLGIDQGWFPSGADPTLGDKWLVNTNGSAWLSSWVSNYVDPLYKFVHPVRGPYDAACGSANGGTFSTTPASNLCASGSASAVTGTGPWSWNCSIPLAPSITVACSAQYAGATPPTISVTGPSNGAPFTAPATVTITTATTAGGGASVRQVDFYSGSTLLGTSTTSPYSFTWNNAPAGSYSVTARVTDTLGGMATSNSVRITVNPAVPPSVAIIAPTNGATFIAPATVTITAAATSGSGASVSRVDFYSGSTLLGSATASPYTYTLTNAMAGSYSLTAKVTDTLGGTATSTAIGITVNAPVQPTVAITAPANGASYPAPASLTITAAATPGTGASVKQVDFYNGGTLLGTSTKSPYSFAWNSVAAGSYSLTAKVTDTLGGTATSTPVAIQVKAPATISLTAPANGAVFTAPASITMTAAATPGTGASVKQVDFYNGSTLLGTSTTSPYSFAWNSVAAGSYSLTAKITDTLGGTATSPAVAIQVKAPATVSITSPGNGAVYNAPATMTITVNATPGTGATVKQVDFYNGSTLLATSTASPYSYTWSGVPPGTYLLTAKVTDSLGGTATSGAVGITLIRAVGPIIGPRRR